MKLKDNKIQSLGKLYVKSYSEVYSYLNENLKKIRAVSGESFGELMKKKLIYSYRVVLREFENIHNILLNISNSGDFYKELFKVYTGENVESYLRMFKKRTKQVKLIYRDLLGQFSRVSKENMSVTQLFKSGVGRILSLYKRSNKKVVMLKEYLKELSKMPDISGDYVVVIAGLPQVGKSTLLSKLTSAKPEIGIYPFTTKTLIVGHVNVEPYGRIVLVDSPGILDSPLEEKNIIEYKAILAIKHLADHLLYVFALYPGFYYTLREQINVFKSVRKILKEKAITTVIVNKIDLVDSISLKNISEEIEKSTGFRPIPISAITGYNLDKIREIIVRQLMEKILHH